MTADATATFFRRLYGDFEAEDEAVCGVIWRGRGTRPAWVTAGGERFAERMAIEAMQPSQTDVYFGVALQHRDAVHREASQRAAATSGAGGRGEGVGATAFARGYASTAVVVPGLWLDVDWGPEGHEKSGLPRTAAEARTILDALPLRPTTVVETGGGWHVYYLFREPFIIETAAERQRIASFLRGWNGLARLEAEKRSMVIDSTWDLSRVFRPAGTASVKHGGFIVREVQVDDDRRYNPDDFELYAQAAPADVSAIAERMELDEGVFRADAEPPTAKLERLCELDGNFKRTWLRRRDKGAGSLPSQSEYDLALASMAAADGWTNEEIVRLIIAHRRRGGQESRLDRPDYFARTLARVQARRSAVEAMGELTEAEPLSTASTAEERTLRRQAALRGVSQVLGIEIQRVTRYLTADSPITFALTTTDEGEIPIGPIATLTSPHRFRDHLLAAYQKAVPRMKAPQWDPVAEALVASAVTEDLRGEEPSSLMEEWLGSYLARARVVEEADEVASILRAGGGAAGSVVVRRRWVDGKVRDYIFPDKLLMFLVQGMGQVKLTRAAMTRALVALGVARRATLNFDRGSGQRTTRRMLELVGGASAWLDQGEKKGPIGLVGEGDEEADADGRVCRISVNTVSAE